MKDSTNGVTKPTLEMWFEFGSNYSYLSVMRIEELARTAGVSVAWKPFLLGPIFKNLGWDSSPFVLQSQKGQYIWRDMARQAEKYGLKFNKPSEFPRFATLPMRVAILGADEPWIGAFCEKVMLQNWVDDLDINTTDMVMQALSGVVPNPSLIVDLAQSDVNKLRLREQTEVARRRGIFGGPTFFVGEEMFWGNDRLEDALAYAQSSIGVPG